MVRYLFRGLSKEDEDQIYVTRLGEVHPFYRLVFHVLLYLRSVEENTWDLKKKKTITVIITNEVKIFHSKIEKPSDVCLLFSLQSIIIKFYLQLLQDSTHC